MGDLSQRMDTRVRAPGSSQVYLLTKIVLSGLPKFPLNSPARSLFLPALVAGSFVLDDQFPGRHDN